MARSNAARAVAPEPTRLPIELEELCKEAERNLRDIARGRQDLRDTKARIQAVLWRRGMPGCQYTDARGRRREIVREERIVLRKVRR